MQEEKSYLKIFMGNSRPKGLNDDLCGKINKNEQLRRVIRYIKKWRNDKYENSTLDHEDSTEYWTYIFSL